MNPEHRLRSIPERTMRDIRRGRVSRQEEVNQEWVGKHVWQKPAAEKPKSFVASCKDRQIEWQTDIIGEYKGSFIIILQFPGLDLSRASFARSNRDYGPNTAVFYSRVGYRGKLPFLVIAANYDILEAQVVPKKKDQDLLFQGEIYVQELADHNATTMTVAPKNGVVTISYNRSIGS